MAVAVAGSPTLYEAASATSAVVPVPTGAIAGEVLVCSVAHSSSAPIAGTGSAGYNSGYGAGYAAATASVPSGWTLLGRAEADGVAVALFFRTATGSEPASYTFPTSSTAGPVTGRMVRVSGADTASLVDGTATTATTGTPTTAQLVLGAVTTSTANDLAISTAALGTTGSGIVAPAEMTSQGAATTVGVRTGLAVETRPSTGSTGTRTWSTSGGAGQLSKVGVLVAFRAVAVSGSVSSTRSTSWNVLAQVASTRTTRWNVAASPSVTSVSSTRSTSWAVQSGQQVSSTRTTTWNTRAVVTSTRSASWNVGQPVNTPYVRPTLRLVVYAPNGARLGVLPTPEQVQASMVLCDVGGLQFQYAPIAPRPELVGQPCEVAVEISPDGGQNWVEPPNGRFCYLTDGRDPVKTSDRFAIDCKSYAWRLSTAKVLPNGLLNADGKRAFLSVSPGVVLKTLLNEAQARGALAGITHASFGTGTDSSGAAWTSQLTVYYEPGLDYLSLLRNLSDQGFLDFEFRGRELRVYNADTVLAANRTTTSTPVVFKRGRDATEAPFRRTWEGIASFAYFAGDQGASYSYTNPAAVTPWGRSEMYIANGSVSDQGTMATLTQTELAQANGVRVEWTHTLVFTPGLQVPLFHYNLGDFVGSQIDSTQTPQVMRLRQVTLTNDQNQIMGGSVVINDRFIEADIRAKRRVEGITNGASSTGNLPDKANPEADKKPPAKVTGLSASSQAYLGPGGYAQAQVTLSWGVVTTNADGTATDDIDHYELWRRPYGSQPTDARHFRDTTETTTSDSPYQVGSNWWFSVCAVDTSGNRGARSNEVGVGMARDIDPPQAPSTPVVTASVGILRVFWDGNPVSGTWPLDFDHVEVHQSVVNNFTPTDATLVDTLFSEGSVPVTGLTYGTPYYYRLIAVDRSGLKSVPSAQAMGTASRLVGSDIDPGAITYEQLGFKDPGNIIPDGSFETDTYRTRVQAASPGWAFTSAAQYHGGWSARIDAATGTGNRPLNLMTSAEAQQIVATDQLFCRYAYQATAGATGTLSLVAEWLLSNGTTATSTLPITVKNGTWRQMALQLTAPAQVVSFRIYMLLGSDATTGTYTVDAVEVRRTVGTSIIQDAAITNALIGNLAVNSAKISDLDVGKLTAGQLNADILVASRIRTATSGNRLDLSSTGLRMYRGTDLTGWWRPDKGQLRIYSTTDLTHTSTGHGLQVGDDDGLNLAVDTNEIMARFNGTYGELFIQREGGSIVLGGKQGGFAADGSDRGVFPSSANQRILMNASVEVSNVKDGAYGDIYSPFMVGDRFKTHLWMDSNEFGATASDGASVGTMYIQPPYAGGANHTANLIAASNSLRMCRVGTNTAGIGGWTGPQSGIAFYADEVQVRNATFDAWRPIKASAFTVSSERAVKTDITDAGNALAVVMAAPGMRWRYRDDVADSQAWHYGPMVEDLPADLHHPMGETQVGLDIGSQTGLLWEALRQLAALLGVDVPMVRT